MLNNGVGSNQCIQHLSGFLAALAVTPMPAHPEMAEGQHSTPGRAGSSTTLTWSNGNALRGEAFLLCSLHRQRCKELQQMQNVPPHSI